MDDTHTLRDGDSSQGCRERSRSPESSCVSMKSDRSIEDPVKFNEDHTSADLRHVFLLLLLLLCFVHESGASPVHVTGKKGGSVTLQCDIEAEEIFDIILSSLTKNIPVCENEECESGRVFKEGSCDVIIKDLIYSDAGKYFLRVYYNDDQTKLVQGIKEYHLHIHDEISVKKQEPLELDVLLSNAYKVEKNSNEGWKKIWTRGHGVSSDRLTDRDETLIIHEFTVNDTGTYRVLDSDNEVWISVTVTESKGKQNINNIRTNNSKQSNYWILPVGLTVALVLLALVLVALTDVMRFRRRQRDYLMEESSEFRDPEELRI